MTAPRIPGEPIWLELFTHDTDAAHGLLRRALRVDARRGRSRVRRLHHVPAATRTPWPAACATTRRRARRLVGLPRERRRRAATAAMVRAHGGQVYVEPMQVSQAGTMAFGGRSDRRRRRHLAGRPSTEGVPAAAAPRRRRSWFELHTTGYDRGDHLLRERLRLGRRTRCPDSPDLRCTDARPRRRRTGGHPRRHRGPAPVAVVLDLLRRGDRHRRHRGDARSSSAAASPRTARRPAVRADGSAGRPLRRHVPGARPQPRHRSGVTRSTAAPRASLGLHGAPASAARESGAIRS